jgi:hypothetical protein
MSFGGSAGQFFCRPGSLINIELASHPSPCSLVFCSFWVRPVCIERRIARMPPAVTFTPHQSSPLARTTQPKGSCSPPCAPANVSKNPWGGDERQLIVIQKRRDTICSNSTLQTPKSAQRYSSDTVLGIIKSYGPNSSPRVPYHPSPSTETNSRVGVGLCTPRTNPNDSASEETVAICKTCKEPSTSSIGVCRQCRTATLDD